MIVLAFIFLSAGNSTCQVDFSGISNSTEAEETAASGSDSTSEEEGETGETGEEIIPARLWIDETVPVDISIKIRSRLVRAFDEV